MKCGPRGVDPCFGIVPNQVLKCPKKPMKIGYYNMVFFDIWTTIWALNGEITILLTLDSCFGIVPNQVLKCPKEPMKIGYYNMVFSDIWTTIWALNGEITILLTLDS